MSFLLLHHRATEWNKCASLYLKAGSWQS